MSKIIKGYEYHFSFRTKSGFVGDLCAVLGSKISSNNIDEARDYIKENGQHDSKELVVITSIFFIGEVCE